MPLPRTAHSIHLEEKKPWHGTELCNVMDTLTFGSKLYIVSASKQYKWFRFAINNCLLILWHAGANYSRTSVSTAAGIYRGEIVQEIVFPDALFSDLMLEKLSSEVNMETHCTSDVNNCYHQKIAQPH
ncbi:hypothetical protein VULLAG_LOCUS14534 [Vulpes lagopus]